MNRSSPTEIPSKPRAAKKFVSSQASGAPSEPCFGASLRFLIVDRMIAIGRSSSRAPRTEDFFRGLRPSLRLVMLTSSKLQPALSVQLSLPPERLSRSHVSCTVSSQCDQEILVHESRYQNSYLSRERCSAFLDVRSPALGRRSLCRTALLPRLQARRPGNSFRPNGRLSRFGTLLRSPRSTSPIRLTTPPFTPKMKLLLLSRIASTKSVY